MPEIQARTYRLENGLEVPLLITDAALAEWVRQREHLRARGYPDRPPDIDSETTRQWLVHPWEPGYAEAAAEVKAVGTLGPWKAGTASFDSGSVFKFLSSTIAAGYRVRMTAGVGLNQQDVASFEVPTVDLVDELWGNWLRIVDVIAQRTASEAHMMITMPEAYAEQEKLRKVAGEAIAQWYAARNPVQ